MYKKIALVGGTAAVILGLGTAALAETGSTSGSPSSTPSASSSAAAGHSGAAAKAGKAGKGGRLAGLAARAVHGQVVTRGKDGTFVTHDFDRGQVTAVSATSITVKAADNTSETFVVNSSTKVRVRTDGKGAAGTISQVKVGDDALVVGTGTSTFTATGIVAGTK